MTVEPFSIAMVTMPGGGAIGLCRLPGRDGRLAEDVATIARWSPRLVVTLTEWSELEAHGADGLPGLLAERGIAHGHFPIIDYGAPAAGDAPWLLTARELHAALDIGGRVLVHCMGGCGRSGMIALRLMIERGESGDAALARLRALRPCAVETEGQMGWASAGTHHQPAVRPK